ncbi:MAG TPA: Tad domain-containing protein [Dehalococcoidia bacterium]|nr:Tad domain-containing protein [Dehalococcoidia bacterium]
MDNERGQMVIIMVLAMSVVFVIGAITVDIGLWLTERRGAQADADLIALAGGVELQLGGSPADALAAAHASMARNDEQGNLSFVEGSPEATSECVTVDVRHETRPLFVQIFGLNEPDVGAHAMACIEQQSNISIYAHHPTCPPDAGVVLSGDSLDIDGGIHTNGELVVTGDSISVDGPVTYQDPSLSGCDDPDLRADDEQIASGPTSTSFVDWPLFFEFEDFDCDFNFTAPAGQDTVQINEDTPGVWQSPGVFNTGTYCSDDHFNVTTTGLVTGTVTFVSRGRIRMSAEDLDLTAHQHNVLFFSDSSDDNAIHISGDHTIFRGLMFTENGGIILSGHPIQFFDGGILGDHIVFNGEGNSFFYNSQIPDESALSLVE